MKRFSTYAFALSLLAVGVAAAAKVHLKNSVEPTVTFSGDDVTLSAALAGLGNGDVTITAEFRGTATVVVVNPEGHPSPGQQVDVGAIGSITIPADEIKNGNVSFAVTAGVPDPLPAIIADLPNVQWDAFISAMDFPTSITLTVVQGGKATVFELDSGDFTVVH